MKILINYADKQYEPARKWNTLTGRYIARFDKVYEYTPNDIDQSFAKLHHDILSQKRGNGLWLWKPYFDTSMTVLPFFAIGYIFRKYTHILEPNKWDKYWILFVLMSGGITYLLSGGNLMYIENKFDVHPIAFYVSGITGTLCVLFISKAIV